MSEASQKAASERAARLKAQEDRLKGLAGKRINVPVAATGLILDRRSYRPEYRPAHASSAEMEVARRQWLGGGERFLLFVKRVDTRCVSWEFDEEAHLRQCLDRTLNEFAARRFVCLMDVQTVEPLKAELLEWCGCHAVEVSQSTYPENEASRGLAVRSLMHPGAGYVNLLTIERDLIERGAVVGVLRYMDSLVVSVDEIEKNWLSLRVGFSGYDADPREVFEIPAVRSFIRAIADAAPWWIGLLSESEHYVWLAALSPITEVSQMLDGTCSTRFEPGAFESALEAAVREVGPLLRCAGFECDEVPNLLMDNLSVAASRLLSGRNPSFDDPIVRGMGRADGGQAD